MTRSQSRALSWIVTALLVSAAAPASAQKVSAAASSKAQGAPSAQELYGSAQKLFDKGSYAEALVAFRQAYTASDSPNARIMIGHCLVALGKPAEAYEEMSATMREAAKRAETEPKYAPTRDAAATQVALLEPKVGKLILEVPERAGVEVLVNGSRVPPDKLGVPIAVDPGTVVIAATRADGRTERREQAVKAGETERVALTFAELGPRKTEGDASGPVGGAKPPGGAQPGAGGDEARTGGGVRTAGFVIAGLGVAGMAVFGVTGMMARSRFTTLEEECGGARCTDPKYADVVDSGMTLTTVANIGLIAGAAGIVGGGLMILLGGPSEPAKAARSGPSRAGLSPPEGPSLGAALTFSPGGAGIHCTMAF